MKKITCIQQYVIDNLIEGAYQQVNAVNITASLR